MCFAQANLFYHKNRGKCIKHICKSLCNLIKHIASKSVNIIMAWLMQDCYNLWQRDSVTCRSTSQGIHIWWWYLSFEERHLKKAFLYLIKSSQIHSHWKKYKVRNSSQSHINLDSTSMHQSADWGMRPLQFLGLKIDLYMRRKVKDKSC